LDPLAESSSDPTEMDENENAPESINNIMTEEDESAELVNSASSDDLPTPGEALQSHQSDHTYASSFSSSCTPPPTQLPSTQGSQSQHSIGSLTQERRFPRISSCISTQNKCCICGSFLGRDRVSEEAMKQAWREVDIYIPKGNRCCRSHVNDERLFTNEVSLRYRIELLRICGDASTRSSCKDCYTRF
jgi:hypothetical protein